MYALRGFRISLQAHPSRMSLTESEYTDHRHCIMNNLRTIAAQVQQSEPIEDLIKRTESESFDITSVRRRINETHVFSSDIQRILEDKLLLINENFSSLKKDVTNVTEKIEILQNNQKETIGKITSLHESSDDSKAVLASIKEDQEKIDGKVTQIRRMDVMRTRHEFVKELETIINVECENKETQEKAINLLLSFFKIIQGHDKFKDEEVRHIIEQRVEWYGKLTLELLDDLIEWFAEIQQRCDGTGDVRFGSIHLPIFCSSVTGLLNVLGYIKDSQCNQRLSAISSTISKIFGAPFTLIWEVEPTSLQSVFSSFFANGAKDDNATSSKKKLILPLYISDTEQMKNAWKMFGGDDRSSGVEKVSGTLSKIFGEPIGLTTAVDRLQLIEAVTKTVDKKKQTIERPNLRPLKRSFGDVLSSSSGTDIDPSTDRLESPKSIKFSSSPMLSLELKQHSTFEVPFMIKSMAVISDSRLYAIDRDEPVLFELDSTFKVVSDTSLPSVPTDVCYLGEDNLVITLDFSSVVIFSTTKKCIVKTLEKINKCVSISCNEKKIYAVDIEGSVYTYDTKMSLDTNAFEKVFKSQVTSPKKIAVSTDGKMIYVCNKSNLCTVDYKGNVISNLDLKNQVQDLYVKDDGTILFCASDSQNLIQFDQFGKKMLEKIKIPNISKSIRAMSYDKLKSQLLIADISRHIHVFEVLEKPYVYGQ